MQISSRPSPRQELKRQCALIWRIERLQNQPQPFVTKSTLEILHHLLSCEMLNQSGVDHVKTVITLMES